MDRMEQYILDNYISNLSINVEYANRSTVGKGWGAEDFTPILDKIYLINEGEIYLNIDGEELYPKKNSLLFIPAHTKQTFNIISQENLDHYYCHFSSLISGHENLRLIDVIEIPYCLELDEEKNTIQQLFIKMIACNNYKNISNIVKSKALLYEIMQYYLDKCTSITFKTPSHSANKLSIVLDYIENNLNRHVTNNELADLIHLHPNYFVTIFKKSLGVSPKKYINDIRLRKAKDLLLSTELNISDITYQLGFKDIYYFSKKFKKDTGLSPSLFRRLYKY
ncbi:helix-turn-helix domain-containing protein [Vallitalea okinawensis]|uniref:helix-turn-helix domain-containing protein n=1 Tax=Vallitalea okinawensis TaxID=2078660 RepID=UPI000CFB3658|nr:AraC family transcriptional regulator [Vallitalea okinawensis]